MKKIRPGTAFLMMLGMMMFGILIGVGLSGAVKDPATAKIAGALIILAGAAVGFIFIRCPYCGSMIRVEDKYCPHCGKIIDDYFENIDKDKKEEDLG